MHRQVPQMVHRLKVRVIMYSVIQTLLQGIRVSQCEIIALLKSATSGIAQEHQILYGQGIIPGVRLLVSDDLINWRQHSWIIDAGKLPADCPYNGRFWAPEIHYIQNKYWLTVNSGKVTEEDPKGMKTHSIWLFLSDRVTGPYKLVNGPLNTSVQQRCNPV